MLEQQRQAYLQAMGIPSWFPRYQLPSALPTPDYYWPVTNNGSLVEASAINQQAATTQSEESANPSRYLPESLTERPKLAKLQIRDSLVNSDKSATISKEGITGQPELEAEQVKEIQAVLTEPCYFQLVCMTPNEQVMLVTELPYSGVNELSALHYSLVNNLLTALNIKSIVNEAKSFKWPFTFQQFVDQSEPVASAAVKAYLEGQLGFSSKKLVILMGATAVKYGLSLDKDFESVRGLKQQGEQWLAVTHSLNEILRLPQYKKEAWKDLAAITKIDWSPA
ncbi:hypothetical protein H0A36_25075 [Endozoicomonas sp. SM1973]|uniref:Uracil-DNA glycosylase-like domain-containing protein n=1 Tax=Spartinivicinus marinus TaxID=2994442 RepID=A0A853IN93_9GAMM|nr:hypothetical protein [Spartinivicinus marinus]MCX4028055.1 hypothetical protein [Spartinivicinus marinus]NYZ69296.1 hypothetical protein [Spartinivicinus marinus]